MSAKWHMMKTERMGLIAVAIMLLALLLSQAISRCSHSTAPNIDIQADSIAYTAADTIAQAGDKPKSYSKQTPKSKKGKTKTETKPNHRNHLEEVPH